MEKKKILLLLLALFIVLSFYFSGYTEFFSLDFFKSQQQYFDTLYADAPLVTAFIFFILYIMITGLSLPGATLLTLIAGALFGLLWGTLLVSFASTLGASVAFLLARFILRDTVQKHFGRYLKPINEGMERDGAFYLFTLRLVPLFPFFAVNLVMALTPIRLLSFMLVSQIGMLAGTLVYVNAGTQIARIETLNDIISPQMLFAFVLLGLFPLLAKYGVNAIKRRRIYRSYRRPKTFDRNLIVIGGGSAGLVSAYIAAAVKARVSLIEKHKMGGDCLNTGCVPSKALIRSAKLLKQIQNAAHYGLNATTAAFDFAKIMDRVQTIIQTIAPHDSIDRYTKLGVDCIQGHARLLSPYHVEVNDQTLSTRSIIIATGAEPLLPPIPGIEHSAYLTSETLWSLRELPQRLIVLGGGPIGCELAQCFARFGSHVTQIEMLPRILMREDNEVSAYINDRFRREGIRVLAGHKASRFDYNNGRKILICENLAATNPQDKTVPIEYDAILIAVGRKPRSRGFGLETLGILLDPNGTIHVNEYLQTEFPNIYACGDVAGPYQFTHTASHQAWYCAVNALFGSYKKFKADYSVIPWATFTDPEVARVGLNELEAREKNIPYEVTHYGMDDLDRAIADGSTEGFVKVLTSPGKDKILGATLVGEHAGDLITEFVTAMKYNIGMNKILGTIHIYPTLAEANKYTAGAWKHAHTPEFALHWLQRYHTWKRH